MAKVTATQQQEINRLIAETKAGRLPRNGGWDNAQDQGLWMTSAEQFDEMYKSIDDIEKFLRS